MLFQAAGETLEALPSRALWWAREHTLIVADLHLGKPASFRAAGVPVPEAATASDLDRLAIAVESAAARRVIILGDMLHARDGRTAATLSALAAWRSRLVGVKVTLVRGNHDQRAGDPPADLAITCVDEGVREGPFELRHHPASGHAFVLCGHVHPVVTLHGGSGRASMRVRCFHLTPAMLTLPAFGAFTGGKVITPRPGERTLLIGPDCVTEAPYPLAASLA
ncbi:MAG: ligase-associated DNA damage response endonuclease PdeM [Phycisphaeraceae bacterium]|nr:ligase-associated DNA damage response endonuclease PdeM [Phycisphaeraceae bacterium]